MNSDDVNILHCIRISFFSFSSSEDIDNDQSKLETYSFWKTSKLFYKQLYLCVDTRIDRV